MGPPLVLLSVIDVVTVIGAVTVARSGKSVCENVSVIPLIVAVIKAGSPMPVVVVEVVVWAGCGSPAPPATALTVTVKVDITPALSVVVSSNAVKEDPSTLVIVVSGAVKTTGLSVVDVGEGMPGKVVYAHASGEEGSSRSGNGVSEPSQLQTRAMVPPEKLASNRFSRSFHGLYGGRQTLGYKLVALHLLVVWQTQ